MRDYALTRAISIGEIGGGSFLARVLHNWRARRALLKLQDFDDNMLRDIGVTRDDVRWAVGQPLTVNAALALEELSFKRRRQPQID